MQIEISKLKDFIANASFKKDGHSKEKTYGHILANLFPNCEIFWKTFIIPYTNRFDESVSEDDKLLKIDPRENAASDLAELGSYHYSIFQNFLFAQNAYENHHLSFFENFYTHLGSVCDSTEEFLQKLYLIILECNNEETEKLQNITKEQFLSKASDWYDSHYVKACEHYLSKGKANPMKSSIKKYILDKYFGKSNDWKDYKTFSGKIRQYRNVIVHNYQIAYI
ncbi:MAG: hypothetical protein JSU05_04570, partial [Bacteroidetes bacterium]|nr:hypothetical protein [Bacteroidota bacterium]